MRAEGTCIDVELHGVTCAKYSSPRPTGGIAQGLGRRGVAPTMRKGGFRPPYNPLDHEEWNIVPEDIHGMNAFPRRPMENDASPRGSSGSGGAVAVDEEPGSSESGFFSVRRERDTEATETRMVAGATQLPTTARDRANTDLSLSIGVVSTMLPTGITPRKKNPNANRSVAITKYNITFSGFLPIFEMKDSHAIKHRTPYICARLPTV